MTKYNTLNVKLSNLQLNKSKSAIKYGTELTLNFLSNLIGNYFDETNYYYPHNLLLTNTPVSKIREVFANGLSINIKFSKIQLFKIVPSGGFIFSPPNEFLSNDVFDPTKGLMSSVSSIAKESKNMGAEHSNKFTFVGEGRNLISKKIKKRFSSITGSEITLANNEIKDIMKVKLRRMISQFS